MQLQEDCLFLTVPNHTHEDRFAVINHDLPDALELAQEIVRRVNLHCELVAALNTLTHACECHGGTVYALRDEIAAARGVLRKEPVPAAPQCLLDAAALLKSLGLDSMVAKDAAELGVPIEADSARYYEARWGDDFVRPKAEIHGIDFFSDANCYDDETDRAAIAALKVGETWTSPDYPTHTVKRIK
jgi:hypothetical protein